MTKFALIHSLIRAMAIGCGVVGAVTDLRSRRIPNWLTGPGALLGIMLHLVAGGWKEGASSLSGLLLGGAIFLVLYLAGGMGAGDVKLMAAEASLLGVQSTGHLLIYTVLVGGVMGVALAVRHGKVGHTALNVLRLTVHHSRNGLQPHPDLNVLKEGTLRLPYAVAIACGSVLTVMIPSLVWSSL